MLGRVGVSPQLALVQDREKHRVAPDQNLISTAVEYFKGCSNTCVMNICEVLNFVDVSTRDRYYCDHQSVELNCTTHLTRTIKGEIGQNCVAIRPHVNYFGPTSF